MSELVVAAALSEVRRLVTTKVPTAPSELSLQLRALQRRGVSKSDLVVHVERLRAQNDVTGQDEIVEENALLALDLIEGTTALGMLWDASEKAAAWVPEALTFPDIEAGAIHALAASDLLPSSRQIVNHEVMRDLVQIQWSRLVKHQYAPTTADFFRAPKAGLTTRPAALLAPQDRLVFEGLAEVVAAASADKFPPHVVWPRGRDGQATYSAFTMAPQRWTSEFVVRTDISGFYESVDHAFLSLMLARHLHLRGAFAVALEAFLDAVMGSTVGLPQGPPGSDVLASAFLLDIDREMTKMQWQVARYSDDILIGAETFEQARSHLRSLEDLLRERGLSLASGKTRISRREKFLSTVDPGSEADAVPNGPDDDSFRQRVQRQVATWFEAHPESGNQDLIEAMALPEQVQWDLLYHESITWEDALQDVDDQLLPPWIWAYGRVYGAEAQRLSSGGYPSASGALSASELRKCLVFMTADAKPVVLAESHAIIDWHPTLVRDFAKYLSATAETSLKPAADFIEQRLASKRDSDVEMAWLLESAVQNHALARAIETSLRTAASAPFEPLTCATALRALDNIGAVSKQVRQRALAQFTPALRAEMVLASTWQKTSGTIRGRGSARN